MTVTACAVSQFPLVKTNARLAGLAAGPTVATVASALVAVTVAAPLAGDESSTTVYVAVPVSWTVSVLPLSLTPRVSSSVSVNVAPVTAPAP